LQEDAVLMPVQSAFDEQGLKHCDDEPQTVSQLKPL
jgi:hypothetical protein